MNPSLKLGLELTAILAAFAAVGISVFSLKKTIDNANELKTIDMIVYLEDKYDHIKYEIRPFVDDSSKAKEYYFRYWDLQINQHQFWRLGYLNDDIYSYWLCFRYHDFQNNEILGGMSYLEGWKLVQKTYDLSPEFSAFIKEVINGSHHLISESCQRE